MRLPRLVVVFSPGSSGNPVDAYFWVSLAAHAFFLAAFVLAPSLRNRRTPPGDALVVSLVAAAPVASVAPRAVAPPGPAPAKVEAPKIEPKKPEPRAIPLPDAKEKKPEPKKGPAKPEPPAPPAPPPPPDAGAGAATPGTGPGITSLDSGDVEFAWYRSLVTSALKSRWVRPVLEGSADAIAASVAFEIRRDGTVADVRVETSSGVPVMDRSVLRAVIEASPLPPLPPSWPDATLPARFEFRWRAGDPD